MKVPLVSKPTPRTRTRRFEFGDEFLGLTPAGDRRLRRISGNWRQNMKVFWNTDIHTRICLCVRHSQIEQIDSQAPKQLLTFVYSASKGPASGLVAGNG